MHAATNFRQFMFTRLNPVTARTALEIGTGRDYYGRQRAYSQQVGDLASTMIPIAFRTSAEKKLWESLVTSMGVSVQRWGEIDSAFKMAEKYKKAHNIAAKGELIYDPSADKLRGLKVGLANGDDVAALSALKALAPKPADVYKMDNYFRNYANMPFTGSKSNDVQWEKQLTQDQRDTIDKARQHKEDIARRWVEIRNLYGVMGEKPQGEITEELPAPVVIPGLERPTVRTARKIRAR